MEPRKSVCYNREHLCSELIIRTEKKVLLIHYSCEFAITMIFITEFDYITKKTVKKRASHLVKNFSFPKVKTRFSSIGQHVVKVHIDDVLQVRQLEEDNLVTELL